MAGEKVNIYDLYKKEKVIKIVDNEGRYTEILVRKLTQADREEAINVFNHKLREERERFNIDNAKNNIKLSISIFNKEQLIYGIIEIERAARNAVMDILPVEDEEKLTKEERKKKQKVELKKWDGERRKQLNLETDDSLANMLSELRVSALTTISASQSYDYSCISSMCYEPETKEKIFKSYTDIGRVLNKKIIEQLIKEIDQFRIVETDKDIRNLVDDDHFLSTGESEKSSTVSPTATKKK